MPRYDGMTLREEEIVRWFNRKELYLDLNLRTSHLWHVRIAQFVK